MERIIPIGDSDVLMRLLFSDEHYFDGEITDIAIPIVDLRERGFSLDIQKICDINAVKAKAATLAERTLAKDKNARREPFVGKLINGEVMSLADSDGNFLFETCHSPVEGNYAHASLFCKEKGKSRSHYLLARNKLRPLLVQGISKLCDLSNSD
ncbi:hypothetical protein [Serratia fonticola]|uniref:hypothetical protein n=1 Tax=Serratia fonticola TaxID=47917 RepID=UPI00192C08A7|nr:hypothetical protein [Serratia fonticola]MBL5905957.1 hypothetical protein [Serratia fonticola]